MTDIYETTTELADLWAALAPALPRDATDGTPTGHGFTSAMLVNPDVLAAMVTLETEIPRACRSACEVTGEPWQPRDDLAVHLRALPRLASRLDNTGHVGHASRLDWDAARWLQLTKRALGLRKPDILLGCPCPYTAELPAEHARGAMLLAAGEEGFLRPGPGGMQVEWVVQERIYCPAPDCGASWGKWQWEHLGRMLGTPAMAAS